MGLQNLTAFNLSKQGTLLYTMCTIRKVTYTNGGL